MKVPTVLLFSGRRGAGSTTLTYHLACMYADLGLRVLATDLDPQADLTSAFLDEDELEDLWKDGENPSTVYGCIQPLIRDVGDVAEAKPRMITDRLALLPGDLRLSAFEADLSSQWLAALSGNEYAFRVLSAFWLVMQQAAGRLNSDLILMDLSPNLDAICRAGLITVDYLVVLMSPDLFSIRGLRILGPTFEKWRREWRDRLERKPDMNIQLPEGSMKPIGYVVLQYSVRLDRPVKAYDHWINRIPGDYRAHVLFEQDPMPVPLSSDPHRLALMKHYRSLMPIAWEARKPIFHLKPADGAIGAHYEIVKDAERDFKALAFAIAEKIGVSVPVVEAL